jgi:hypothetical protein
MVTSLKGESMKTKMAAAGVAFALAVATLGLTAGPAGASTAGTRARVTVQRLPVSAVRVMAPDSYTSTCDAAAKSASFTAATRLDWCAAFAAVITVFEDDDPVGTATIDQVDYASWKVSSRTWNLTNQIYSEIATAATGVLIGEPVTIVAVNTCSSGCSVTSNGTYTVVAPDYPAETPENVGVDSPGTATVTGSLTTTWTYTADALTAVPPLSETTVGVRCDSQKGYKYPAGCANPSFQPTYVLSAAKYPAIAKFDKAELAKHPSWSTLTRATPTQKKANRALVCKGFKKTSKTDSCDEFPYASTTQGGAGAAQEHVNVTENKAQGGNLVGFYNSNRLFYGENFSFKIS